MKVYKVKVNGKVYEVELESVSENKESIKAAPASETATPASAIVSAGSQVVSAPMQGTILSVNVNVNDTVKKGQVLMILEAMKLENEILAPVDGVVKAIKVSKGQSVNSKQELLVIG